MPKDPSQSTTKENVAIAVKFEKEKDRAPKVTASGKGLVADLMLELAREKNIFLHKDQELSQLLSKVEVDTMIPLEAYNAVAEILAYIYKMNKQAVSKK